MAPLRACSRHLMSSVGHATKEPANPSPAPHRKWSPIVSGEPAGGELHTFDDVHLLLERSSMRRVWHSTVRTAYSCQRFEYLPTIWVRQQPLHAAARCKEHRIVSRNSHQRRGQTFEESPGPVRRQNLWAMQSRQLSCKGT